MDTYMNTRFVGWNQSTDINGYQRYYTDEVFDFITNQVMANTSGVDYRGPIKVSREIIRSVLDSYLLNFHPRSGDIYNKYTMLMAGEQFNGDFGGDWIINNTIAHISQTIINEYKIQKNNMGYSAWNTLSGVNSSGIQNHPEIKLRRKRPTPFQFHMKF